MKRKMSFTNIYSEQNDGQQYVDHLHWEYTLMNSENSLRVMTYSRTVYPQMQPNQPHILHWSLIKKDFYNHGADQLENPSIWGIKQLGG